MALTRKANDRAASTPLYVVDTSVVVKWYVEREEAYVAQALQLLERFDQGRVLLRAPQLLLFEIANALTMSYKLQTAVIHEALHHLKELNIDLESFSWWTLARAVEIAVSCRATVYDSYFLAAAIESDSTLVTADEVFLRKTRRYPNIVSLSRLRLSQ